MKALKIIGIIVLVLILVYFAYQYLYPKQDDKCKGLSGIQLRICQGTSLQPSGVTNESLTSIINN